MIEDWINLNKTQKTNYFKTRLNKGLCKSLKKERNDDFNDFMELFKHHPESDMKLLDVVDLCIVSNKRNSRFYEINVIRSNGEIEDISYRCCINQRNNYFDLNQALRYAIEPQIKDFRNANINKCVLCGSMNNIQIDHIIMFKNLVSNFLKKTLKPIPDKFDDNEFNSAKFKPENKELEEEWFNYHKKNAILRCLCSKCNKSRKHTNDIFINDD